MVRAGFTKNNQKSAHTHCRSDKGQQQQQLQQFDALQTKLITPFLMKGNRADVPMVPLSSPLPLPLPLPPTHLALLLLFLLFYVVVVVRLRPNWAATPLARSHGQQSSARVCIGIGIGERTASTVGPIPSRERYFSYKKIYFIFYLLASNI